jgi:hypothetical protein
LSDSPRDSSNRVCPMTSRGTTYPPSSGGPRRIRVELETGWRRALSRMGRGIGAFREISNLDSGGGNGFWMQYSRFGDGTDVK